MDNLRSILLMVLGMAVFATCDGVIKLLASHMSVGQIILGMGVGGAVLYAGLCARQGTPVLSKLFFHPVVAFRSLAEGVAAIALITSFTIAPLSTVAAIMQSLPLFMTLFAAIVLKETVGIRRWSAVLVGFIGVIIIIRPTGDDFGAASVLALFGTLALGSRDLASRYSPTDATTPLLGCYSFAALIPAGLVLLAFTGELTAFDTETLGLLSCIVLLAFIGMFLVTASMRIGELSVVSPFRYTRLPFAALVGYVLFAETPDTATWIGAAIVTGSGVFIMLREAKLAESVTPEGS